MATTGAGKLPGGGILSEKITTETTGLTTTRKRVRHKHGDLRFTNYDDTTTSNITIATTTMTLIADDEIVICNGTFTITLPAVAVYPGKRYYIKNKGTGIITVGGNSLETIDGETTQILTQYDCMEIENDGTEWHII